LISHNTNIDCFMLLLFLLFYEWFKSCMVDFHGVIIGCKHHMFRLQHGWHKLLQCWWQFSTLLLSTFKKSIITTHNLSDYLTQGHGIKHGLSIKGLSCFHGVQIKIGSWTQHCPIKFHMLVVWIHKCTQKLGMILSEEFTTCLLLYVLCLNYQKKH